MCGIAGIVGAGVSPESGARLVAEMTRRLRHRGPDDHGLWNRGPVHLGHRRLSILDLSQAGHQPMTHGPFTIVYNGEIYNFAALRKELGGEFRSRSDTEVVLRLYEQLGPACVHRLEGMFAFAIWDESRRRLFIARDRLGIKPLLYRSLAGGGLAFASELKSLVGLEAPLDTPAVDRSSLSDFFSYKYIPTPKTIWSGVAKLPAAHWLLFEPDRGGEPRLEKYWEPDAGVTVNDLDVALEEFEDLLGRVVKQHTLADVPVGVFLSGGIDSTTLVANLDRPSTFTLGFDIRSHDESSAAREIAAHFATEHHEELATHLDVEEALEAMPALYDEPFGDHGSWAMFMVARLARQKVKVALTGEGGDEMFAGYHWYDKHPRFRSTVWNRLLASLLPTFSAAGRSHQRRAATGLERYSMFLGPFTPAQKTRLLGPELSSPGAASGDDSAYDDLWHFRRYWRQDLDPLKRLQWADLHTYLVDDMLTKVDRATMAVSLEARPPFVDHRIVEFVLSLAPELLRNSDHGKVLPRRFLAGKVPPGTLTRRKIGFSMPVRRWIRQQPALLERALSELSRAGILRSPLPRALDRVPFNNEQCWCLLVLDRWWRASGASL